MSSISSSGTSRRLAAALVGCVVVAACAPGGSDSSGNAAEAVATASAPTAGTGRASDGPHGGGSEQDHRVIEVVTGRAGQVGVRHLLVAFAVPFSVVPPDPAGMGGPWHVFSSSTVAGVTLDNAAEFGHPGLTAYAPDQVHRPGSDWQDGQLLPAPDSIDGWVAWLRGHPQLQVSDPQPITTGGVAGQQVVVTVDKADQMCTPNNDPCVPLMPFPDDMDAPGPVGFFRGDHQLAIVEVDGQIVLVQRAASTERFADAADTLEALVSSLRWSRR